MLNSGTRLGPYVLSARLGKGGMGEVYRAHDGRLGRDVAVKVISPATATHPDRIRRFELEAQAAGALNHPNVVSIHDVGEYDGVPYVVMELLDGESLRERMERGPVPLECAVDWVIQAAGALAAAHEKGIVHRDIKPENLFLTSSGLLKVLDFGLAKLTMPEVGAASAENGASVCPTGNGAILGTVGYMAPEQLRGETAGPHTDIFALGAVLYELIAGRRAFRGVAFHETSYCVLYEDPPPLTDASCAVPRELEAIVRRCLEKRPEDRFPSARGLASALGGQGQNVEAGSARAKDREEELSRHRGRMRLALASGASLVVLAVLLILNPGDLRYRILRAGAPRIDSLAVLPLTNLMGDSGEEYFVEGMHEALTAELSKIGALKVISRTSAMRFKGTDKPMPRIARELGVTGLVEGSVLRDGGQVRITVQLIHGSSDRHLWAESYQRELRDVLALQREVAQAIAYEIRIAVTPVERARLARAPSVNPEAYDEYLKGRHFMTSGVPHQFAKAVERFESAIKTDPAFAQAYAGLAEARIWMASSIADAQQAREAALYALTLDQTVAEAHAVLGLFDFWYGWAWSAAERNLRQAIALNPGSAVAHNALVPYLLAMRRFDEAHDASSRACELDPFSSEYRAMRAAVYYYVSDFDRAEVEYRNLLDTSSQSAGAYACLGLVYLARGEVDRAAAAAREVESHAGGDLRSDAILLAAYLYGRSGRTGQALEILHGLERLASTQPVPASQFVAVYAGLGDRDAAFVWLEKAYQRREWLLTHLQVVPVVDPLREDPRFRDFLQRMGFPPPTLPAS